MLEIAGDRFLLHPATMSDFLSTINLRRDLPASIAVALVALPLCLGISLASGADPITGLISGIVGGLLVGCLSGSHTSVSGPAAGLSAVVLISIEKLGGYEPFLVAIVIAGFLQMIAGGLRLGNIAHYFPSSVIRGLLAGIGVILIFKQIPHALGVDKDPEGDFSFFQPDNFTTLSEFSNLLTQFSPLAIVISCICLVVIIAWDRSPLKKTPIPSPLVAVFVGGLINWLATAFAPTLALSQEHLVDLPELSLDSSLFEKLPRPSWVSWSNPEVWIIAVELAIVASLETLLNLEAVDKLDPHRRHSPPNRELVSQGIGNVSAGYLGGLPVTSVIVRSSMNINMDAASKLSSILHGVWLIIFTFFAASLLSSIPYAALAAILLVIGYKLASLKIWKSMWSQGLSQFLPFAATVGVIFFTDLLKGIVIGLIIGLFFVLRRSIGQPMRFNTERMAAGGVLRLQLAENMSFLNRASVIQTLNDLPKKSNVVLDATGTDYIDQDILEVIKEFRDIQAPDREIDLSLLGFRERYEIEDQVNFVGYMTKQRQSELTPSDVVEELKAGNARFVENQTIPRNRLQQSSPNAAVDEHPMAAVLGCIDSQSPAELIFDLGPGDIFNVRVAGNLISPHVIESLEYAIRQAGAPLILILGNTKCSAIQAAMGDNQDQMPLLAAQINQVMKHLDGPLPNDASHLQDGNTPGFWKQLAAANVEFAIGKILESSPTIRQLKSEGSIDLVGALYNSASGKVEFLTEISKANPS